MSGRRELRFLLALLLVATTLLPSLVAASDVSVADLDYMTEQYFPYNYEEQGKAQGISVEVLRLIWAELGVEQQPIAVLPWARGYALVQYNPVGMLFSMARIPEREDLFGWVGPIASVKFVLVAKKSRKLKIATFDDIRNYSIGTIIDDISDLLLKEAKTYNRVEPVKSVELNLKMLGHDRIDVMAHDELSLKRLMVKRGYDPEVYETVFVLKENSVYYAFNKNVPAQLLQRFQTALDAIKSRPVYQGILDRHLK